MSGGFLVGVSGEKKKTSKRMKLLSRMTGYSVVLILPQRAPIPCDDAPTPGDGADESGEEGDGKNVVPILDDESHIAGSRPLCCRLT